MPESPDTNNDSATTKSPFLLTGDDADAVLDSSRPVPSEAEKMKESNRRKKEEAENEAKRMADIRSIQKAHPKNLVARVKALIASNRILLTDMVVKDNVPYPRLTEMNLYRIFDALFVGKLVTDFHCDTSRRIIVDENGEQVDGIWDARNLFDAVQVVGLRSGGNGGLTMGILDRTLKRWALSNKFNDISERVRYRLEDIQWDGTSRLESYLIETLGAENSADNRLFSKYWCLSLYNRVMSPGCLAPISMAMFGAQDAGKSHFQNMICREALFDPKAAPVTYDPSVDKKELFRNIYGISIIATIAEMTGFGKADLRKMKATLTGTTDTYDQKYVISGPWRRQFIFVMDSNRYAGLFRDDDDIGADGNSYGERRWFPIFVGQIPGATGEIRWTQDFRVDFGPAFVNRFWQMMKECAEWMAANGNDSYERLVLETTTMVKRFSRDEKNAGQGIVKDENFDEVFSSALYRAVSLSGRIGKVTAAEEMVRGLTLLNRDFLAAYKALTGKDVSAKKVTQKMKQLKGVKCGFTSTGKNSAYVFDDAQFGKMKDGRDDLDAMLDRFWCLTMGDEKRDEDFGKTDAELSRHPY